MQTPKKVLLDHIREHHRGMAESLPKRPQDARGNIERLTHRQLHSLHAEDHHRYRPDHDHWNGTEGDLNLGPSQRPSGWRTGLDVRARQ